MDNRWTTVFFVHLHYEKILLDSYPVFFCCVFDGSGWNRDALAADRSGIRFDRVPAGNELRFGRRGMLPRYDDKQVICDCRHA